MNKRKLSYPDYLKNLCIDIILNIEIYPLLAFLFNRLLNFAAAKSLQSFPTLCDPIDIMNKSWSLTGSSKIMYPKQMSFILEEFTLSE